MSFSLLREKALPDIPIDVDDGQITVEHEELWLVPSSKIATSPANTGKALPSINVENTLSGEEMYRLHELWNEAGLSARAHRRRRRQKPTPRRIPSPISIPEPEDILPTLTAVDPSTPIATPPTTGLETRKRWGFLSARPCSEKQEAEKKSPSAIEVLRTMAQGRLKKRLRYAKSAPNLGDQAVPSKRGAPPVKVMPEDISANSPRNLSPPAESATPAAVFQPEEMDQNAIYFTIDPTWRESQGSIRFEFITPLPDSPTSSGRPDSPLLHRHHSLDQLSFAAQQAIKTLTTMKFPVVYASDENLYSIDELHTYLEL